METSELSRKERRVVMFGTQEQREGIKNKYKPRDAFYVLEQDGRIIIPEIAARDSVIPYMMPWTLIPEDVRIECTKILELSKPIATNPSEYTRLINDWFYNGLTHFKPKFRSGVFTEANSDLLQGFTSYVGTILSSFEPEHNHKMLYLAYVFSTCCIECEYSTK